jgi:hypothetical protein
MGVLGTFGSSVTLVNRTNRNLSCRYDGEDITLHPGDNAGFPLVAVPYAKKQNPLMGSKHPNDPRRYISLVGVKGTKDDCTPIPDEVMAIADGKLEVVDRSGEFHGEPMGKRVLLKKSGYTAYEAAVELPDTFDVNRNIQ